jgi:hypothetical protein
MKALDTQRKRALLYYILSILFMVATLAGRHTRGGFSFPCGLAAALFGFLGLRARYNLTSDSN